MLKRVARVINYGWLTVVIELGEVETSESEIMNGVELKAAMQIPLIMDSLYNLVVCNGLLDWRSLEGNCGFKSGSFIILFLRWPTFTPLFVFRCCLRSSPIGESHCFSLASPLTGGGLRSAHSRQLVVQNWG
jgi:hypothetical protein